MGWKGALRLSVCLILLLSAGGPAQVQAANLQASVEGVRVSPAALAPALVLTDSVGTFEQMGLDPSEVLRAADRINLAQMLDGVAASIGQDAASLQASDLSRRADFTPEQASQNLRAFGEVVRQPRYYVHIMDNPPTIERITEAASPNLHKGTPADVSADPGPAALEAVKGRINAAIGYLRPLVERPARSPDINQWDSIFDKLNARIESGELRSLRMEPLVDRRSNTEQWDWRARELIGNGSLDLSRSATVGRRWLAPAGMSYEDVKALSAKNFRRAATLVVTQADTLPLSLATFERLNFILTEGLVPDELRGSPWYHGDENYHQEIRDFYRWLEGSKGQEMLRKYPVALAERMHFLGSAFDVAADCNGRTARLMADLALMGTGLAPALYTNIKDYFDRGSFRSGVSTVRRQAYFREIVEHGQIAMASTGSDFMDMLGLYRDHDSRVSPEVREQLARAPGHEGVPFTARQSRVSLIDLILWYEAIEAGPSRRP